MVNRCTPEPTVSRRAPMLAHSYYSRLTPRDTQIVTFSCLQCGIKYRIITYENDSSQNKQDDNHQPQPRTQIDTFPDTRRIAGGPHAPGDPSQAHSAPRLTDPRRSWRFSGGTPSAFDIG